MAKNKKNKKRPQAKTNSNDLRTRKKEAVMGNDQKKSTLMPIIVAVVLVAAVAGGYTIYTQQSSSAPVASSAGTPVAPTTPAGSAAAAPGVVSYPVALFEDGQAKHFDFKDGGKTIRYFVIKSADGVIRAAFDACDVCWPAGKGYYQDGDDMVCRNCGRRFASNLVNEVQGGCNPAPLKRSVDDGMLVIHPDDIRKGAGFFNL
jgi:uncharacterized membrane protein